MSEMPSASSNENPSSMMLSWINDFVANRHPDLGRPGTVCPFVPEAIRLGTLTMEESDIEPSVESLCQRMLEEKERFLRQMETIGDECLRTHCAHAIIFTKFHSSEHAKMMDEAQAIIKIGYMNAGLMIGQFNPYQDTPGIRNKEFRPNRTSVPVFAFISRNMVPGDSVFIHKDLPKEKVPLAARAVLARFRSVLNADTIEYLESFE